MRFSDPEFLPARNVSSLTLYEIWKEIRQLNTSKQPPAGENQALDLVQRFEDQLDNAVENSLGRLKFVDESKSEAP